MNNAFKNPNKEKWLLDWRKCLIADFLKAKSGRPPSMGEINLNHRWPNNKVGPLPDPMKRKLFENDFFILN